MSMVNLRICILISTLFVFSCKTDESKSTEPKEDLSWPKVQDSVGSIFEHYQRVMPLELESKEARFSAMSNGKWGVIDEENNLYFPFEFDSIISNESSIALKKFSKYQIFDQERNLLGSVQSDDLRSLHNGFYVSERGNRQTLVNPNGVLVLDHRFQHISVPKDASYFLGKSNESWEAFDLAGSLLEGNSKAMEAARWLNEYIVLLKSYGPLKIGMTKEEVEKVFDWPLKELYAEGDCYLYSAGDDFLNFEMMLNTEKGIEVKLERIYIRGAGIITKSGVGIGSMVTEVNKVYGDKIEKEENKDDDNAHNLFYVPTDRKDRSYRLNFLSRYGMLESYSLGRLPSIQFVGGCL